MRPQIEVKDMGNEAVLSVIAPSTRLGPSDRQVLFGAAVSIRPCDSVEIVVSQLRVLADNLESACVNYFKDK